MSTTLLSQVDASVGGKNGVNYEGYKNMVGTFTQPDFILCDPLVLKTLPDRELLNGCAEIVKYAVIADPNLFGFLENSFQGILERDVTVIEKLVHKCVAIKAEIVNRDESEKGERRKLNLGHTFGHALEKVIRFSHGEAVSAGMVAAEGLSVTMGLLSGNDKKRIEQLLQNLKLPTRIQADPERLIEAMSRDKKKEGDRIHFVLPTRIGEVVIRGIGLDELRRIPDFLSDFAKGQEYA